MIALSVLVAVPCAFALGVMIGSRSAGRAYWFRGYFSGLRDGEEMERRAICAAVDSAKVLVRLKGRDSIHLPN